MKRNYFFALVATLSFYGCGSSQFAITEGSENLEALTKVTDKEERCITPFGGDNGQNLFFAAMEDGKYFNIYYKENAFSASMAQRTSGKNQNYSPAYSASTGKIAFRCQNEGSSTSDIFMINASGGRAATQITETSDAFEDNPSFSPDGKILIYNKISYSFIKKSNPLVLAFLGGLGGLIASTATTIQNSELWTKNLETGENTLLASGYDPRFSPDGKSIVYVKLSEDGKSRTIWTMNLDGTNQTQITDAKRGDSYDPCWSPDGKQIVFQTYKKDKKDCDIYVIDADGENLMQITKNKSFDGEPYWTTDGYIYFTSNRGNKKNNYQIWRFKME
jgi:TolB protein